MTSRLSSVLSDILSTDEYRGDLVVLFSEERSLRSHEVPNELRVGGKSWVVLSEDHALQDVDTRLADLELQFHRLEQTSHDDALTFGRPLIQNLAAQLLLFALGRQPQAAPQGTPFLRLAMDGDARLQDFVQRSAGLAETSFARMADTVISRRNATIHFSDYESLKMAVNELRELARRHPNLRANCKQEFVVFDHLEELAASFGLEPVGNH
jgi:hypothetical protein